MGCSEDFVYHLRVLDIRQTLPNLKYLLYVATAGEGELPARKAGGVRGLLNVPRGGGGEDGMPVGMKRAGSDDSSASGFSGMLWHGKEAPGFTAAKRGGEGKGKAAESLRALGGGGKKG